MSSDAVLARIRTHLHEECEIPLERITPEASFRTDLGTDSLDLISLVNELDDLLCGARVSDEDLIAIETVGQAVELVLRHRELGALA